MDVFELRTRRRAGTGARYGVCRIVLLFLLLLRHRLGLFWGRGWGTPRLDELLIHTLVLAFGHLLDLLARFACLALAMLLALQRECGESVDRMQFRHCSSEILPILLVYYIVLTSMFGLMTDYY